MSARLPRLRLPAPRLLPLTIMAMAGLIAVKSIDLVRAAAPEGQAEAAHPAASPETTASSHHPAPAPKMPQPAVVPDKVNAETSIAEKKLVDTPPAEPVAPSGPPVSDSERTLLLDLRQRRMELDARETALATRESILAAAEHRISVRVDELTSLQVRLESLETARRERDDANWRGMVKLYEAMKPRDAAVIFNDLDQAVLLPILDRMKEAKAALVLAAMQPDRARQATDELARLRLKANAIPAIAGSLMPSPGSVPKPASKPSAGPVAAEPPAATGGAATAGPTSTARHG